MRSVRIPVVLGLVFALGLGAALASAEDVGTPTEQVQSCLGKVRLRGQTFATGSAEIVADAKPVLDLIATAIQKNCVGKKITIEGHTDVRGSDAYNQRLSEERAAAVKTYLVAQGVPADELETVGYGETRPLSHTHDALNRRVTFVVDGTPARPVQ
ncbi:MAG TPA: OmpA family protein [Myxococcota bacterium]|jgi:OOP family OmpA-OmpF porin|nr:OmpA family protein [Myxococcota bacterium]